MFASVCVLGLALSSVAGAQRAEVGSLLGAPRGGELGGWRERAEEWGTRAPEASGGIGDDLRAAFLEPGANAGLGLRVEAVPPPISRETLEGKTEGLHAYEGVPGGVVLGLEACAVGALEGELAGARLEANEAMQLVLRLADGRTLTCPALAPERLRACLAFTAQRLDGVVDLTAAEGAPARVAPAFAGSELEALLVRMDRIPHGVRPETRAYKTLIVDRAVRLAACGDELVLSADLEVRLYVGDGSGWARRAGMLAVIGADFIGPRCADDLSAELAPLSELAAWLGFLRRIERVDPAGIAALRARFAP